MPGTELHAWCLPARVAHAMLFAPAAPIVPHAPSLATPTSVRALALPAPQDLDQLLPCIRFPLMRDEELAAVG